MYGTQTGQLFEDLHLGDQKGKAKAVKAPKLPKLLNSKIYKTGQTRGADDDQIFQNRVGRNSTVLIPYTVWEKDEFVRSIEYENGFTVLISPGQYRGTSQEELMKLGLEAGKNLLVFYEQRSDWLDFGPQKLGLEEAKRRTGDLGGQYVARIANTTSAADERINRGFTTSGMKGAGIRQFEYADKVTIDKCRLQLEAVFWCAVDAHEKMESAGMTADDIVKRRKLKLQEAAEQGLLDWDQLEAARIINNDRELVCPLCLEPISAAGFLSKLPQATGRERHDLTVTEINLFHIAELSYGALNHRPYNLGWGHHHCNVVCKDAGIKETLAWMQRVVNRNLNDQKR